MSERLAVIIPCYNHARYVGRAIESVLGQTRAVDRFLVIDDGSTDESAEVIRGYAERGVELIVQENAGAHETLNRAAKIASEDCDFISILNSDDIYEPARFEKLMPLLTGPEATGKSVAVTGLTVMGPDDALLERGEPRARWKEALWSMQGRVAEGDISTWEWMALGNFPMTTSNVVARADYLVANPFRPYRFNHDYFFLAGAAIRDRLMVLPEPLLKYRVHPENNINSAPAPLLKEMLRMHLDLYRYLAAELRDDAGIRRRFYEYTEMMTRNVSSFHAGIFQLLLAQLASGENEDTLEKLVGGLDETKIPELNEYPNRGLVNAWDGQSALVEGVGLTQKLEASKEERRAAQSELKAARELARLRGMFSESRWCALGRVFGALKGVSGDRGKTAREKLDHFSSAAKASGWLKLGTRLGSGHCRQLLARIRENESD